MCSLLEYRLIIVIILQARIFNPSTLFFLDISDICMYNSNCTPWEGPQVISFASFQRLTLECYCFYILFIVIFHGVQNIPQCRRTQVPQRHPQNPQLTTVFLDFSGSSYIYIYIGWGGGCMGGWWGHSCRIILVNFSKVYKSTGLQVSQVLLSIWVNSY